MSEQFLNTSQICAALEEVGGEGMAEPGGVAPGGGAPCLLGQSPQDQEGADPGEGAALGVQEELGPAAAVEEGPPARHVAAQCLDGGPPPRPAPFLVSLADPPEEPFVEVDAAALEADGLRD